MKAWKTEKTNRTFESSIQDSLAKTTKDYEKIEKIIERSLKYKTWVSEKYIFLSFLASYEGKIKDVGYENFSNINYLRNRAIYYTINREFLKANALFNEIERSNYFITDDFTFLNKVISSDKLKFKELIKDKLTFSNLVFMYKNNKLREIRAALKKKNYTFNKYLKLKVNKIKKESKKSIYNLIIENKNLIKE